MSRFAASAFLVVVMGAASCSGASGSSGADSTVVDLHGAGASFPAPLYDAWFKAYVGAHPTARIDYQSVGSGAGVTQFTNKTVDFGASDAAMSDEEISKVDRGVQLLPMTAGAIVLAYNLPDLKAPLRLSRDAYTGIFLGKITKWNDPVIAKANPGVTMPATNVTVVHRADSSGTSFVFTQHLSAVSEAWNKGPGTNKAPNWPVGIGAKGNEGVTAQIKQTPGAIGYIEYGYAKETSTPFAVLQNKSGAYVEYSTATAQAALAGATLPDYLRLFIPDPDGAQSYPIVTYTWILLYKDSGNPANTAALRDVLKWCLSDGQKMSESLGYIPLPDSIVGQDLKALDTVK